MSDGCSKHRPNHDINCYWCQVSYQQPSSTPRRAMIKIDEKELTQWLYSRMPDGDGVPPLEEMYAEAQQQARLMLAALNPDKEGLR